MAKAFIIIDRVTDQVLSWWAGPKTDKWNAAIDNDTNEIVGGAYLFHFREDAVEVVKILEGEFKDEEGGIDFEILKVSQEVVPARVRTVLI